MNPVLMAFIKVNLSVALFYLFYKILFDKDTFLIIRRIFLLMALIFSILLPWIDITSVFRPEVIAGNIQQGTFILPEFYVSPEVEQNEWNLLNLLITIYVIITSVFIIKIGKSILSVFNLKRKGDVNSLYRYEFIKVDKQITPFSFMRDIYLNPDLHSPREMIEILIHENTHVRQLHSLDILLAEIFSAICWFNPFAGLLKKEIRQNLEYIADNAVLSAGLDHQHYQYHLLRLSCDTPNINITNQFNISPLKKRINMMNKTKTRKPAMMKYLLVAPLTLGLIMTSNLEILANQAKEMLQTNASNNETIGKYTAISEVEMQQPQNQDKKELKVENKVQVNIPATTSVAPPPPPPPAQGNAKSEKISQDEVVYQSVEKMPAFPGGDAELINYLTHNIKYPAEAAKKGIQGRVICQFVVNRDGSVANVEAVRSVDPELDAEAIRVITAMPKWTPGTQKGETVRVKYTLPINFRLGDEKPNPAKATALEPGKQPVYLVNGEKLPEGMNINSIKPETIEKIDVTKPENEIEKAKLISKYGPNGANGIVNITLKK